MPVWRSTSVMDSRSVMGGSVFRLKFAGFPCPK
jgi:hypothetical protein